MFVLPAHKTFQRATSRTNGRCQTYHHVFATARKEPLVADQTAGPTVLRLLLGARLRQLREAKRITPHEAAQAIRGTDSKISRIELGRSAVREIDAADLLTLYGVTDTAEREELLTLAAQSSERGWWHRYSDVVPDWLQTYLGLEQAARSIRAYQPQLVPGLLQTEAYAFALMALADFPPEAAWRRVELRKERQRRLRQGGLNLWAIIDEAPLRRRIGSAGVMREQLQHLLEAGKQANVTIQVTPFDSAGHTAPGAFSLIRFENPDLSDVVYVELLSSALYIDKRADIDEYLLAMERLAVVSPEPRQSAKIIESILAEWNRA
jgi:transcriptional regulator with XRE-family HTH domain